MVVTVPGIIRILIVMVSLVRVGRRITASASVRRRSGSDDGGHQCGAPGGADASSTHCRGVFDILAPWGFDRQGGLYYAIEAELAVAVPDNAMPAQASVFFFQQTVARVFHNHQRLRIQQTRARK
jgi:hypothetical protein